METTKNPSHCKTHDNHAHVHGPTCGHKAVTHDGHTCYEHDGHFHLVHGTHVDECKGPKKSQ